MGIAAADQGMDTWRGSLKKILFNGSGFADDVRDFSSGRKGLSVPRSRSKDWLVLVGGRSGLGVFCTDAQSSKCPRTLSRHCFQGILELRTTVTTDLIGSVADREHAAERLVMAAKQVIGNSSDEVNHASSLG